MLDDGSCAGQCAGLSVQSGDHMINRNPDRKALFEVEDATFMEAGNIGLWTKADSVTVFDDLRYGETR